MLHSIKVDRLYNLGQYQNIHIESATSEIPDEVWNNAELMDKLRLELTLETFMNYALHREVSENNAEMAHNGEYSLLYERFRSDRHQEELIPDLEPVAIDEI